MKKLDLVRASSAALALGMAGDALAQGASRQPSFAISSSGVWSMIGLAVGVGVAIWAFRKVT